ncbi:hypothetical protein OK074_6629 [Actinobacteria bacterium OK074]|nr:hypothetical protein OK074_6629 [Actinobacteria bacterium OK074]
MSFRRALGGRAVAVFAAAASAALTLTVSSGEAAVADQPRSQQRPTSLAAENGDVLSSEPGVFYLDPLKAFKVDARVHRIMYRTTDRTGKTIAVTGTVLDPPPPRTPNARSSPSPPAPRAWPTSAPLPANWPKAPSTRHCPSRNSSTRAMPWW